MKTFRRELIALLNKHSKENFSNTPDFILADYLINCLNAFNLTTNRRTEWYGEKLIRSKVEESRNEFEKEIDENEQQSVLLFDDIDFNNLCARATLYPGKSIEEVQDMQYVQRLEESYKFINAVLLGTKPMNTQETRQWVTKTLEGRLKKYGVVAQCSETNNLPEIIDQNLLIAKVMRNNNMGGTKFIDLIFGEDEAVKKFTLEKYADQQMSNFIQKGI